MFPCKLCGQPKPLVKAHIIPRAFYAVSQGRGGNGRIISDAEGHRPQRSPVGIYDKSMLCAKCDGYLGQFDQHAVEVLLATSTATPIFCGESIVGKRYDAADPDKILRFVASVAWRASHCNHEFFRNVRLGRYEGNIKKLLQGTLVFGDEIGCLMSEFDSKHVPLLNPQSTRFWNVRFWIIPANRFMFFLKTDRQAMPNSFSRFSIRSGSPVVSLIRSWQGSDPGRAARRVVTQVADPFKR